MKYDGLKMAEVTVAPSQESIKTVVKDVAKVKEKTNAPRPSLIKTMLMQAVAAIVLGGGYYGLSVSNSQLGSEMTEEVRRAIIYNIGYSSEGESTLVAKLLDELEEKINGQQEDQGGQQV